MRHRGTESTEKRPLFCFFLLCVLCASVASSPAKFIEKAIVR